MNPNPYQSPADAVNAESVLLWTLMEWTACLAMVVSLVVAYPVWVCIWIRECFKYLDRNEITRVGFVFRLLLLQSMHTIWCVILARFVSDLLTKNGV